MFTAKQVVGRRPDGNMETLYADTEYRYTASNVALNMVAARPMGHTWDIFEGDTFIARVHPDGGIDYAG